MMYWAAMSIFIRLVATKAQVTAGLRWPPEMCIVAETMIDRTSPWATAMPRSPTFPPVSASAQMEPAPMKERPNAPISSAMQGFQATFMGGTSMSGWSGLSVDRRAVGGLTLNRTAREASRGLAGSGGGAPITADPSVSIRGGDRSQKRVRD